MAKLLFLAGSARTESINKKLARAAYQYALDKGCEADFIDLRDYDMPIYDGDMEDESGLPENAKRLKQVFCDHDGIFIASPEYNSAMPPLLQNALDWISRKHADDEAPLAAFRGKVFALSAASPGALGGLRGLVPLRMMLGNVGAIVTPTQAAIGNGGNAFDGNGKMTDEKQFSMIKAVVDELHTTAAALTKNP